jgi:hypothetical protein
MIYEATIFIENVPKRVFFFWHTEKIITKLTHFLVETDSYEDGKKKVAAEVEKYKEIDPKFYADKIFKTFLCRPK